MPTEGPIRRAQLISPFGVGAMTILPNGTSVVIAGLDHWYEKLPGEAGQIDESEFVLDEWRLSKALGVSHFRLPPDYRRPSASFAAERPNQQLKVPVLRFPTWNFCPRCRRLSELPLESGGMRCIWHEGGRGRLGPYVAQVPLVAICSGGHLLDFPWHQWVHEALTPGCTRQLYLRAIGGASLAAQIASCECGKKRNLAGVTEIHAGDDGDTTVLTNTLDAGAEAFRCPGTKPWHGTVSDGECGLPVKASLRSASNLYYSLVKSSIYLPRSAAAVPTALMDLLSQPPLSTVISLIVDMGGEPTPASLRRQRHGDLLSPYDDELIASGLAAVRPDIEHPDGADPDEVTVDVEDTEFRIVEHQMLRSPCETETLVVRVARLEDYESGSVSRLGRLTLVENLRETRALWGFNRIYAEGAAGLRDRKAMLRRDPADWQHSWLPAYVVNGEGLYVELDPTALAAWEARSEVEQRTALIQRRFDEARARRQLHQRAITPRLLLLHTLGHLLINRLTFECGYSSAALRERLYVSPGGMAGVLIYTASGDSEGTMGGLVRMGRPGFFEPVMRAALRAAEWCSADPVCMDVGESGQGPDSCNLAACHGCALVPETACEEFNRFLDRGLLVGTHDRGDLGFFSAE